MLENLAQFTRGNLANRRNTLLQLLAGHQVSRQTFFTSEEERYLNISTCYRNGYPKKRIAVSAHYDKVPSGEGALDNGSGVIVLLSLLARLQKEKPEVDVTFLFFDGEEEGCLGSSYFVRNNPPPFAAVYNADVVGSGSSIVVARSSLDLHSKTFIDCPSFLIERTREVCLEMEIPFYDIPKAPMSDHVPFNQRGIPAVWLCTLPAWEASHWKMTGNFSGLPTFAHINGPSDTLDKVDLNSLQLAHHVMYNLLKRHFS